METNRSVKRVCIDLTPLELVDRHGGIGRYTVHLLRECLELPASETEGIEFSAMTSSYRKPIPGRAALEQIQRLPEVMPTKRHRFLRRHVMGRMLRSSGIDLFHSTEPGSPPGSTGYRMVQTIYDVIPVVMPNRSGHPWMVRVQNELDRQRVKRRYGSGEHAISISLLTKNDMVEHLGIPADRISVVHLGVNMADFSAATDPTERQRLMGEHQLPEKWFICVSSDHYRKNHQRLFDAWCQVAARVPEGLVFVGRPLYESTLQKIESEVRERGLQARFRWIRNLSDEKLPALYRQATAAVAPSLYEGFGMTVLEAMACGAPVLAARNGAYEEVGSDAAEYFDPRSVEGMAAQLARISGDESLRVTMRQRGLVRAAQKSWTQMARETVAVYRKLLGVPQA